MVLARPLCTSSGLSCAALGLSRPVPQRPFFCRKPDNAVKPRIFSVSGRHAYLEKKLFNRFA